MRVYRGWGAGTPTKVSYTPEALEKLKSGEGLVEGTTVQVIEKRAMPAWVLPVAAGFAGVVLLGLGWSVIRPQRALAGYRRRR